MAQSVQGGREMQPEEIGELVAEAVLAAQILILPKSRPRSSWFKPGEDVDAFLAQRFASLEG